MSDTPMSDEQDQAEALDWDEIGTTPRFDGEMQDDYPPDRPLGVTDEGVIPSVEQLEEPIEDRVAREVPDPLVEELDREADAEDAVEAARDAAADDEGLTP